VNIADGDQSGRKFLYHFLSVPLLKGSTLFSDGLSGPYFGKVRVGGTIKE